MKFVGTKTVKLSKVVLPGDFRERAAKPHISRLAESIGRVGLIHLPVVEAGTMRLLAGHDRVAALMASGVKDAEVRLVEGEQNELEVLSIAENACRRNAEAAAVKAYLDLTKSQQCSEQLSDSCREITESVKRGRPKGQRGRAREEAAKDLGKSERSVARSDQRAAAKEREQVEATVEETPEPPCVETYGLPVPKELLQRARELQEWCKTFDAHLRRLQSDLTEWKGTSTHVNAWHQQWQQMAHDMGARIRGMRPTHVCPWCKLHDVENCRGCGGIGLVGKDAISRVETVLLDSGEQAGIYVNGKWQFMGQLRPAQEQEDLAF